MNKLNKFSKSQHTNIISNNIIVCLALVFAMKFNLLLRRVQTFNIQHSILH